MIDEHLTEQERGALRLAAALAQYPGSASTADLCIAVRALCATVAELRQQLADPRAGLWSDPATGEQYRAADLFYQSVVRGNHVIDLGRQVVTLRDELAAAEQRVAELEEAARAAMDALDQFAANVLPHFGHTLLREWWGRCSERTLWKLRAALAQPGPGGGKP